MMYNRNRVAYDADGVGSSGGGGGVAGGVAGGGAAPVAFAESLPEDIRGEAAFRDIKDLGSLAKGYLHAQKLIGADPSTVLRLPPAEDAAAWDAVYGKLGRPAAPGEYKFSDVKLPDGLAIDDGLRTGYQEMAHKAGLTASQADAVYGWYNGKMGEMFGTQGAASAAALEASVGALKTEWGAAFDQNVSLAKDAIRHYGGDKLAAELDANGLGNSPELARIFAKMGRNLQEDGLIGRGGSGGGINSPGEAQQQINALRKDASFSKAYTDKRDPGHADAVARMEGLYQQAYPEPARA